MDKPNCSQHKKEVAGITDMKQLAEQVGDLHYEALKDFLLALREKLGTDAKTDEQGNRTVLAQALWSASSGIYAAYVQICRACAVSKQYMK